MNRTFAPGDIVRNVASSRGCLYTIISVRRRYSDDNVMWHVMLFDPFNCSISPHSIISDSRYSDWVKIEFDENE